MQKKNDAKAESGTLSKDKTAAGTGWLANFLAIKPLLFRVAARIVRPDEIEDIVQETFILSYAASRKKNIDNPRPFMMTTAKNIALNINKRADKKLHFSFDDLLEEDFGIHAANVEECYQAEEMFIYFCRAVAELPIGCRRVFILKKVYGLSQAEIAERFGISVSMVEKHVAKGMATTGSYMVAHGYWDEAELFCSAKANRNTEAGKP